MSLQSTLNSMKRDYESAVRTATVGEKTFENGRKAKTSLICSKKFIAPIHEYVKAEFVDAGVNEERIWPPIGETKGELKLMGLLKPKDQDVSFVPDSVTFRGREPISNIDEILSANVRSQLSSLKKNFDTLYERTYAEAFNLHARFPKQCLGEVYLIPTHSYNPEAMVVNRVEFKGLTDIERYIQMFQKINNRSDHDGNEYKYERVCLLIVDFRQDEPKLYSSIDELKSSGFIASSSKETMSGLNAEEFASDLLNIYHTRFTEGNLG